VFLWVVAAAADWPCFVEVTGILCCCCVQHAQEHFGDVGRMHVYVTLTAQ
jgi:hypothetical protein